MKDFEFFKLEDRVLFEAAAAAEIVDAAEEAKQDPNANVNESDRQAQEERDAVKNAPPENPVDTVVASDDSPEDVSDVDAAIDALINGEIPAGKTELVVINDSVPDKAGIIASLKDHQEVLILQDGNGLEELNEFLDNSGKSYSAIHLITHGNDGYISVNGEMVNPENFDAGQWREIGEHLTENGDILLYGCDTAANAEGKLLVNMIADASGADVAASTDTTGISGDWELEYSAGMVETGELDVDNYKSDLATIEVDTLEDTIDDTDGKTSLREAIIQAMGNGEKDEIVFVRDAANGKITLTQGELTIDESLAIIGNGVNKTVIDGNGEEIFKAGSFGTLDLEFSDLTLQNGVSAGDGGALGIYSMGDVNLTLKNVTITNCVAEDGSGGAVSIVTGGNVELDVINSTLYKNMASIDNVVEAGDGGAIYIKAGTIDANIVNSTITGNKDASTGGFSGGGLFLGHTESASLNLLNSIVLGNTNTAGNVSDIYMSNADPTTFPVTFRAIHSVYGETTSGNPGIDLVPEGGGVNSRHDLTASDVFGSNTFANGVIQVNNQNFAGYGGTLIARDEGTGEYSYFDVENSNWKNLDGSSASPVETEKIFTDQLGADRGTAKEYLNINEFFIGAVAGKTYLSVTPQNKTVTYDGKIHTADVVYTTASGKTVDVNNLPDNVTITTSGISAGKNAGTYDLDHVRTVINDDATTEKFDLAYDQSAKITIEQRKVTLTSGSANKIYDGTALTKNEVTVTGDGFVQGEGADFLVTGTQTNAGSSKNTFTYTLYSNTDAGNYVITKVEGDLTVGKRDITITVDPDQSMTYGGMVPVFTYQVENIVAGESLNGKLALESPEYSTSGKLKAGSYDIVAGSVTNAANPNYNITNFSSAEFTVNKLTVELNASVQDKVYDGNTNAGVTGADVTNLISGDKVAVDVSNAMANFDDANAGNNKDVTITGGLQLTGEDSDNYRLVYDYAAKGDIQVKKVDVTLVTNDPYISNGTDQSGTVSAYYTDVFGNKQAALIDWQGKTFAETGYYQITISIADPNYQVNNDSATLTMYAPGIGGEGIGGEGEKDVLDPMRGDLTGNNTGDGKNPLVNVYTMGYSELVARTMLDFDRAFAGEYRIIDPWSLKDTSTAVSVDVLRYNPMTLDHITVESAVAGDFFSGNELFSGERADTLIQVRGDAPVSPPESLYIESDADAETLPWYEDDPLITAALTGLDKLPEKVESFKSDWEKLLDEMVLA